MKLFENLSDGQNLIAFFATAVLLIGTALWVVHKPKPVYVDYESSCELRDIPVSKDYIEVRSLGVDLEFRIKVDIAKKGKQLNICTDMMQELKFSSDVDSISLVAVGDHFEEFGKYFVIIFRAEDLEDFEFMSDNLNESSVRMNVLKQEFMKD